MFTIYGKYSNFKPEAIDTADTREEAEFLVQEYRMAFGRDWTVYYRKHHKKGDVRDERSKKEQGD